LSDLKRCLLVELRQFGPRAGTVTLILPSPELGRRLRCLIRRACHPTCEFWNGQCGRRLLPENQLRRRWRFVCHRAVV